MSGDEGDATPPGGLLAHTRNEERRRREAEYKAAQERHARAARELAEAEKRRQQPDEVNFSACIKFRGDLPLDSLVDLRTGRRLRPRPRPGESHGCRPARAAS
jgi:hypothetical protein